MRTIVWFRGKDLRLSDHAPLREASQTGEVVPLFVLDPYFFAPERARERAHRVQFLLESLTELANELSLRGSRLIVVPGKSVDIVPRLFEAWKADRVVAQRWVEPFARERDHRVGLALGGKLQLCEGETLLPPGSLRTLGGTPYRVFGHFARAFRQTADIGEPLARPRELPPVPKDIRTPSTAIPTCEELGIARNAALLTAGEAAAKLRLRRFIQRALASYAERRGQLDLEGTSRLSADLKFGTLSPRQAWSAVEKAYGGSPGAKAFLDELIWREFAHSTLWDHPELLKRPFRPDFVGFPWEYDEARWQAWVLGHTGYPVVDASARQLLAEGFVHNRARMISASFLTKHLLIDYRLGEAHYAKYLTDGDWANNNMGWQWSAGAGCDAQPYFRVFNPVSQGEKFDAEGHYVGRWVPELARLPAKFIHRPWEASERVLRDAGVRLGSDYPPPVVDHHFARARFLDVARRHLQSARHLPRS